MKTALRLLTAPCVLLLAAGCAYHDKRATYTTDPYGNTVISSSPGYTGYTNSSAYYDSNSYYHNNTTTAAQARSDSVLEGQVREQLGNYGRLGTAAQNVRINCQNGQATLSGSVPTRQERDMIDTVVRNTPGILSVNDQMQITGGGYATGATGSYEPSSRVYSTTEPSQAAVQATTGEMFSLHVQGLTPGDRNLAQRIIEGLQTDTTLATVIPRVNINVAQGQVSLRGNVQSEEQRRIIENAVRHAAGVPVVEDQLRVVAP
ncbi:MAG TPA: BON domain-containing protein [Candidatus Dormibacteraeota bacterium]|nr:BON domain-containing protein [Candidatus Dormibacteraeota bacterium]